MRRVISIASCAALVLLAALPGAGPVAAKDRHHAVQVADSHLPGTDGPEAAVRAALVRLRKGEAEDVSDTELGRRQLALMKAEGAYRAAVSKAIFDRMVTAGPDRWVSVATAAYGAAKRDRELADEQSGIRLQTYHERADGDSGLEAAVKARIETQLRLTRLRESAAHEVLTSQSPVICIYVDFTETKPDRVRSKFDRRCTSRTIYRLAQLAERIAASFPDGYVRNEDERDADLETGPAKEMAEIRNRLDMAEYRRVALSGVVVDPETYVPVGGILRIRVAENAERALVQFLDRIGRRGDYTKLWSGEPLRDLGGWILEEVKKRPDYKILRYLETGEEPTPRAFFLILARVIRAEQEAMVAAYTDGYLGGSFDQVDLEQLLRVSNAAGTGEDSIDDVKVRLERFLKDMDAAHDALVSAREMAPPQLEQRKPRHYQLMREMGYIELPDDDPARARYVIPETQHSFRAFAMRASGAVNMPGKGMLSVVNLRNAGQAAISVVVPELAAARFAYLGRNVFLTERAWAAATFAGEAMAGTLVDASFEAFFNWKDAKPGEEIKGVEWDRLILESVVLGSVLQFTGGAVDAGFSAALKTLGSETPKSALYQAIKRHPLLARHAEAYARTALGLASETALVTFFQMYVQGNMDATAWKTVLMNAALSRAVASGIDLARNPKATWRQIREYLPKDSRAVFDADPKLAAETVKNVNKQLAEASKTLQEFQERTAGQAITGKRLFRDLASGELTWRDLTRVIFPAMKAELAGAMESLRIMRQRYFNDMKREAIKRSIHDVNRFFDLLIMKANQEISDPAEFRKKLDELEARREAELQLVRKKIIAPGSEDPTSDIDRSSQSQWVRRHLRALYDAGIRFHNDGDAPTSARAFDVNEYINVLPFITESSGYMAEMRRFTAGELPGNLRQAAAMEALGMASAMRARDAASREIYFANKRRELQARIDAGDALPIDMRRLERQIRAAKDSLAKAEQEFEVERQAVAERHPGLRDSEIDLLATDAIYDRKMAEISKKQFELSQFENPNSPEALALRAEIMRDMKLALRGGIETYSSPVGLDIIVTRVQQAKRSDGEKMKVADRLDDPNFTLEGELSDYTARDAEAVVNDQIMFIAEHVLGFSSGHEGFYETGRALGKYVERAFLGMKIAGLDIAEVRKRPQMDPHRRLLEAAQALVAVKDNPDALLDVLENFSRTSPRSHEAGMAELFWLIETVLPGMKDMTGVLAERTPDSTPAPAEGRQLDAAYRRLRMVARMRWRAELELVRETLGPDRAVVLVDAEIARTQAEIEWIERRLAELAELGAEFLSRDWKEVGRLQHAIYEARVLVANLPDPRNPLLAEIEAEKAAAESKLEDLRRPLPYPEMVRARLYESGAGYRRLIDRAAYLGDRLGWLKEGLEKERKGAEKARTLMAIDLAGDWICESKTQSDITAVVTVTGDRIAMTLDLPAPLDAAAKLDAERRWGTLEGSWQVSRADGVAAAGLAEARPTEDGKELQFTTGSTSDPELALDWSSLVCRRDRSDATAALDLAFVTISFEPQDGDPETGSWAVDATKPRGVEWVDAEVRLRRSRKVYGKRDLEPGSYLAAISLGGQIVTRPVEIKPGKVMQIALRPAAVRLTGPDTGTMQIRLHPAGDPKEVLTRFRANRWVAVVPGTYDLELATTYGSAWVTGIDLKPGQSLDVETRTGMLLFDGDAGGGEVMIRRAAVEGAGAGTWTLSRYPGRIGPLPPGKYDIVWEESGAKRRRQVTVQPGEENRIDLR